MTSESKKRPLVGAEDELCFSVSIVIPVYKVEAYIHTCVESVLAQTYSNLEIILVNDGSPDRCGQICDEYASNDKRITVIHKKNGGLSDARNAGTLYASGDFIIYLDSDDWLAEGCIKTLVLNQIRYNADIVQCNFYYAYEDYLLEDIRGFSKGEMERVLKPVEALELLIGNVTIKNFAWGKLIRAELAKRHSFPKGKLYEDTYWTHHVIGAASQYVLLKSPLLYYRQREGSISCSDFNYSCLDRLEGMLDRQNYIRDRFPKLMSQCVAQYLRVNIELYNQADDSGKLDIKRDLVSDYKSTYRELHWQITRKWKFFLFYLSPRMFQIYQFICRCLKFLLRKLAGSRDIVKTQIDEGVKC